MFVLLFVLLENPFYKSPRGLRPNPSKGRTTTKQKYQNPPFGSTGKGERFFSSLPLMGGAFLPS